LGQVPGGSGLGVNAEDHGSWPMRWVVSIMVFSTIKSKYLLVGDRKPYTIWNPRVRGPYCPARSVADACVPSRSAS
jgi:hypothetical protein